MKAAIYARFSTENQSDASIEDQIRACRRCAEAAGLTVVVAFDDRGISGGTAERPGYQALLAGARAGQFEVIVAEDISRLWRNRSEYGQRSAELEDLGVHLVTCVGDDTRRDGWGLVLGIKQAIAEAQRREISYRTKRGLEGLALAGKSTGGRTYGYRSATEVEPSEAAVVRQIFLRGVEGWSVREQAGQLNRDQIPSPRGGAWGPSTVSAILRNPRYAGAVIWGRTEGKPSAQDSRRKRRLVRSQAIVERQAPELAILEPGQFEAVRQCSKERACTVE